MKIKFIKPHNGYAPGETIECDPGVADAIVNWARAAEYVSGDAPATPEPQHDQPGQDKALRPHGGKQKVRTK